MLTILRYMILCSYRQCLPVVYGQDMCASSHTEIATGSMPIGASMYRVRASMRFGWNNMRRIVLSIIGNRMRLQSTSIPPVLHYKQKSSRYLFTNLMLISRNDGSIEFENTWRTVT